MNMKIKCQDCGEDFIFSEKDQKFYEEKGFQLPKRCKNCRNVKKDNLSQLKTKNKFYKF